MNALKDDANTVKAPQIYATNTFPLDHIIPISRGCKTELNNLAHLCTGCNQHKYNKIEVTDPLTRRTVLLYNPRVQRWVEHFCWNEDGTLIIGITEIGRATVIEVSLNRRGLINLRKLLRLADDHPPD